MDTFTTLARLNGHTEVADHRSGNVGPECAHAAGELLEPLFWITLVATPHASFHPGQNVYV